ncbi:MAG: SDR family oxidoreductase [Aureispira sp.]|nr:SDR family oxidoreductase [Aureispira sp.]
MNKVILITGASSGIGAATARLLAPKGYFLMLAARREEKLKDLVKELGENAAYTVTDMTKASDVQALVDTTKARFGQIDILINNAGIGNRGNLHDGDIEAWSNMIDLNVKGVLYATRMVLPLMLEQGNGHVINVGSVASHSIYPNVAVYCATKHAVRVITEGLRLELGGKIKGTLISPGASDTEFPQALINAENKEEVSTYFASGLNPEEVAKAIVYTVEQPQEVVINEVIIRPNRPPAR